VGDSRQDKALVDNPSYKQWLAQDQQVLSYLLSSMTKEILVQVASYEHAFEVWKAISDMFASRSKSRVL
jgi:trimethylamine:corrinoid methyltransferase-like protein